MDSLFTSTNDDIAYGSTAKGNVVIVTTCGNRAMRDNPNL